MEIFKQSLAVVALAALVASIGATHRGPVDLEAFEAVVASEWRIVSEAAPDDLVEVLFAVSHSDEALAWLDAEVKAVSYPDSPRYGDHTGRDGLTAAMAPEANLAELLAWLTARGVDTSRDGGEVRVNAMRDFVTVALPAKRAASVFETGPLLRLAHRPTGRVVVRSLDAFDARKPVVPTSDLRARSIVDTVVGLHDLPVLAPRGSDALPQRKARAAFGRDDLPSDHQSNAPQWDNAIPSDKDLYFLFSPICKDGNAPQNSETLCTNFPPTIANIDYYFNVTSSSLSSSSATAVSGTLSLADGSISCNPAGNSVLCQASIPVPGAFELVLPSLQTIYSDGSKSDVAAYPAPVFSSPFVDVTLAYLFYGIPANISDGANDVTTQAVVEWSHNYFSPDELYPFLSYNGLPQWGVNVVGPDNPNDPEGEADQDIQWIMGIGQGVDSTFWSNANKSGFVLQWQEAVGDLSDADTQFVWSISYGQSEGLTAAMMGEGYMPRAETEFKKMAARGMTVVIADGDSGVSSGLGCKKRFAPDWPASSGHVVSVGASVISSYSGDCTGVSVKQGQGWTTGGGFSDWFAANEWQAAEVGAYLTNDTGTLPPQSFWNNTGRAFPDLSILGSSLLTFYADQMWLNPFPGAGTSFSAPIFAGMVGLANTARNNTGKANVGLLTPLLYSLAASNPEAFYDVTIGDNSCIGLIGSNPADFCCPHGFKGAKGYDAVSGIGSPIFSELFDLIVAS